MQEENKSFNVEEEEHEGFDGIGCVFILFIIIAIAITWIAL